MLIEKSVLAKVCLLWEEVVREAAAEVAMGEAAEEVAMVKVEALMEQARD